MKTVLAILVLSLSCPLAASNCKDDILSAQGETMVAMAKGKITVEHSNLIFRVQEIAMSACDEDSPNSQSICQKSRNDLAAAAGLTALARHRGEISRKQNNLIKDMQAASRYTLELYCSHP
jgi:hypothetical protein